MWKSLTLNASPAEVASALAGETGIIWLDSAVPSSGSVSILCANPTAILRGRIDEDWAAVEACLSSGGRSGGVFGWVGFDGRFTLGIYPDALKFDHDSGQWSACGKVPHFHSTCSPENQNTEADAPQLVPTLHFIPRVSQSVYTSAVRRAQSYISAGDILSGEPLPLLACHLA